MRARAKTLSWKVGALAGVEVRVHATFLLLVGWVALDAYVHGGSVGGSLAFIAALFALVVLHELGHALTARRYGIRTRDITLLPIGGIARLEREAEDPRQELWIAVAGPAVNYAIAAVLFAVLAVIGGSLATPDFRAGGGAGLLPRLVWTNLSLATFNLLPAFPLDGGRALRALLAMRMDRARATAAAARIGEGLAVVLGVVGVMASPVLAFIAVFIWLAARAERSQAETRAALAGVPVARVMLRAPATLAPADPVARAVELALGGLQHDFPVLDGGAPVGMLDRAALLRAVGRDDPAAPVADFMRGDLPAVAPGDPLDRALALLHEREAGALLVTDGGAPCGLVTLEGIGELLALQAALRDRAQWELVQPAQRSASGIAPSRAAGISPPHTVHRP